MDSISKTTDNAFVSYFNMTRRFGFISKSERKKLLLLWFLNRLKHDGLFLYNYEDDGIEAGWKLNVQLANQVERVYRDTLACLTENSCLIHYFEGDCTPLPSILWYMDSEPDIFVDVLVTNDTDLLNQNDGEFNTTNIDAALSDAHWTQNSYFMTTNDSNNSNVYLTPN